MKFDIGRQWNGIGEEMEVTDCMGHVVISVGPPAWVGCRR